MNILYIANERRSAELAATAPVIAVAPEEVGAPLPRFLESGEDRLPYLVRLAHDGRILDVNAAGLAAFRGATRRAVIGSSIYAYVPEEHRDAIRSLIRNA